PGAQLDHRADRGGRAQAHVQPGRQCVDVAVLQQQRHRLVEDRRHDPAVREARRALVLAADDEAPGYAFGAAVQVDQTAAEAAVVMLDHYLFSSVRSTKWRMPPWR